MKDQRIFSISGRFDIGEGNSGKPKYVKLLDSSFKTVRSFWLLEEDFLIDGLIPDLYELHIKDPSGEEITTTVDLTEHSQLDLYLQRFYSRPVLQISKEAPVGRKSSGMNKQFSYLKRNSGYSSIEAVDLELMIREDDKWKIVKLPKSGDFDLRILNPIYTFNSGSETAFLSVGTKEIKRTIVSLPRSASIELKIKKIRSIQVDAPDLLELSISTNHKSAETLLDLLNSGAMLEAKSFVNAQLAEDLLQDKIQNPWAAAIGGYYLLRVKDMDRLHNWANNLANWFEWLPDGPIIHAWQMISESHSVKTSHKRIRKRLLEAQKRGIPIFTEGLKLLLDGLSQLLTISNEGDKEVNEAFEKVKHYAGWVDWNCKYVTIRKIDETLNGWQIPKGILNQKKDTNLDGDINYLYDDF